MMRELREECEEAFLELAKTRGYINNDADEYSWQWSFDKLQQDVSIASTLNASINSEGYNPEWTVRTKTLVSILRDEQNKLSRARTKEITNSGGNTDN